MSGSIDPLTAALLARYQRRRSAALMPAWGMLVAKTRRARGGERSRPVPPLSAQSFVQVASVDGYREYAVAADTGELGEHARVRLATATAGTESAGTGRRRGGMWRARFETVLIVAGFAVMLLLRHHEIGGDGLIRLNELTLLLQHGTLSPDKYSLIGPIFSTPLWLLGTIAHRPGWVSTSSTC